jgi:glycosyltransferase involved in cell wall biosynthesis
MTRVTVVVPVYNHEKFIAQALLSVIDQNHPDIEVICIDDGSRDASVLEILDLAHERKRDITVVPKTNAGAHNALNSGLDMATGELVMFLNSDDFYPADRVSTFVRAYERLGSSEDFWGFSGVTFVGDEGEPVDPVELGVGHLSHYTDHAMFSGWTSELLAWHNVALTSGNIVATASLLTRVGAFSEYAMVHDWDMVLRLLAVSEPVVVSRALYAYRIHGNNTFRSVARAQAEQESLEARNRYKDAVLARTTTRPYASTGTPFVDYMRLKFPLIGPFTY